jgi:2-succinyl-5-enolpyruvyl-6-hydroxy-3-cyclohexene-1-carboxylate synthase
LAELIKATPTIRLDSSGRHWDPWQSVEWTLAADLLPTVSALESSYGAPVSADWVNSWLEADRVASGAIQALADREMWEGPICRDLMAALPQGALLRLASSMPIRDVDSFGVCAPQPISVSSNRGVNGIDGLIATSLGEAQIHSGPVAVYAGDLSFLHDIGSLSTAPRPTQPVVLTIVDNRGGGIFSYLPMAAHDTAFEPWFLTPHKTDIAAVAAAHGLPCWCPETMTELRQAWSEAFQTPGLSLVYIAVDRERSVELHFEAWRRITQAVEESP